MLDIQQAQVTQQWQHDRPLTVCRFDRLSRYLFCGSEDAGNLQRFLLADGSKTSFTGGHETWVMSLACSPDGQFVMSGGGDGRLCWWDSAASAETPPVRKLEAHQGWIRSAAVSPDGKLLATGGNDLIVRLWSVEDGSLLREFAGHERHVYTVAFHPAGEFLLTGDLLGKLRQWQLSTGECVRELHAKELHSYNGGQQVDFGGIRGISVSPDGAFLALGGLYKASNPLGAVHEPLVQLYHWESGELAKTQIAEGITQGSIWRLQHLADGKLMGVSGGGTGGFLLFWDAESEKDVHRFKLPSLAREMDLSPAGDLVATAHHDRHVRLTRLGPAPG